MIREGFPKIKVKYESVADDCKGLITDNEFCRRLLNLTPINPYDGIREHIMWYAA